MNVGLVTEGTYPFHAGGVSVWCDQLVSGLTDCRFSILAVCATGHEPLAWTLPATVAAVHPIPLWGSVPSPRRSSRAALQHFATAHQRFVDALVEPDRPGASTAYLGALETMYHIQNLDLQGQLLSNESLARLLDAWNGASKRRTGSRIQGVEMTFADALTATDTISHFVRPLSLRPPTVDLVHAVSNGLAGLVGIVTKWAHGVPLILTEHGLYLRERYLGYLHGDESFPVRSIIMNFFRLLTAAVYQMADAVRPSSLYNKRWELRSGARPDSLETVYNGIEPARFRPSESEPAVPTVSWLGRIDPLKDLHTLIHAFGTIVTEIPDARLRLFGGTPSGNEPYRQSCQRLVGELGLERSVTFEGVIKSSAQAYEAGHIVVLSSVSEGFPFTVLEAMASSKATVSTDVGGVSEAVGDTGIVVPPRDPQAMAKACIDLLRDSQKRRTLGAAARTRVTEYFTLDQNLAAYRHIYRHLAVSKASRATFSYSAPHVVYAGLGTAAQTLRESL